MTILVTGGAGFIGSNFIHRNLRIYPSEKIVCVDKLTYAGNLENLTSIIGNDSFCFERADIADTLAIHAIFEKHKPEIVINFAAESHVDKSIEAPGVFITTNVIGTQVLLDASQAFGVLRFHQVSTDEVFGDLPLDRPDLLFTESTPINPSSPYSASKASADLLCQAYARTYKMPITISRCSNNYGPYHFPEKLIPLMIINAMRDKALPVYGEGINVRDWLFVDDHCSAIDAIIRHGVAGETYNIGGNEERRNIDVVHSILDILGKPKSLVHYVADRPGHDLRYAVNSTKMFRELSWQPKISFDEGLRATVQWYQKNQRWWENILSGEYRKMGASV